MYITAEVKTNVLTVTSKFFFTNTPTQLPAQPCKLSGVSEYQSGVSPCCPYFTANLWTKFLLNYERVYLKFSSVGIGFFCLFLSWSRLHAKCCLILKVSEGVVNTNQQYSIEKTTSIATKDNLHAKYIMVL